jgi:hypothetical protein
LVAKLDVDGVVLAQPLFVESVEFPNNGRRAAVFIATSTNRVYAFDANPPFEKLWETFLGNPFAIKDSTDTQKDCTGQMAVTEQEPRVAADGINSTPVIDVQSSHIIVNYRTIDRKSDNLDVPEHGANRIAALNLADGKFAKGMDGRDLDRRVEENPSWNKVHRNCQLIGNHIPKISQSAHNPVIAPVAVLAGHANDQLLDFSGNPRSARTSTSF